MYAEKPEYAQVRGHSTNKAPRVPAFISEAPALFGGAVVSLGVMGAIFVNAMWFQPAQHPGPMFTPRTAEVALAPVVTNPVRTVAVSPMTEEPPVATGSQASKEILREVQTALASRGYYAGKLDGVYGSRTRTAIETFQKDHSMPQDGKASVRLLTQVLMSASSAPAEVPVPKATVAGGQGDDRVATLSSPTSDEDADRSPEQVADGMVARIQAGLRRYGYDDVVVDGRMGQQTATAIQRFQLDFGMKITGEPSATVLQKLEEVGA